MDRVKKPTIQPSNVVSIHGTGNVVAGRDVVQVFSPVTVRTTALTLPGISHITDEQAASLKSLVDDVVKAETVRRVSRTHASVWSSLNKAMKVPSYRLIPLAKFPLAKKYLQTWLARLLGTATAARKVPDAVRSQRIRYIQTNMKQSEATEAKVRAFMATKLNAVSLAQMNLDDLGTVYRYVASIKRRNANSRTGGTHGE